MTMKCAIIFTVGAQCTISGRCCYCYLIVYICNPYNTAVSINQQILLCALQPPVATEPMVLDRNSITTSECFISYTFTLISQLFGVNKSCSFLFYNNDNIIIILLTIVGALVSAAVILTSVIVRVHVVYMMDVVRCRWLQPSNQANQVEL